MAQQQRKLLGKILEEMKVVTQAQLKAALRKQMEDPGKKIGEILIESGSATSTQITEALARQFGYPFVDLKTLKIPPAVLKGVTRDMCEQHTFLPIKAGPKALTVAMSDPLDLLALDNLK